MHSPADDPLLFCDAPNAVPWSHLFDLDSRRPTCYIVKKTIMDAHGQRWNLRKFASFSCQLQVNAARVSQFLDAETCANFRKFHRCPWASMGH